MEKLTLNLSDYGKHNKTQIQLRFQSQSVHSMHKKLRQIKHTHRYIPFYTEKRIKIFSLFILIAITISCAEDSVTKKAAVNLLDSIKHTANTVVDIDGNIYRTVKIGEQIWMQENLKVTHFRNGDSIPNIKNDSLWGSASTGAFCDYNNDTSISTDYGRLYNWYAVSDTRNICPTGWHVATRAEWDELIMTLGGTNNAGDILKKNRKNSVVPDSMFLALYGGGRSYDGTFYNFNFSAYFWNSDTSSAAGCSFDDGCANECTINADGSYVIESATAKKRGMSVRCVKDK